MDPNGNRTFDDQGRLTKLVRHAEKVPAGQRDHLWRDSYTADVEYSANGDVRRISLGSLGESAGLSQTAPGKYRFEVGDSSYDWKGSVRVTASRGPGQPAKIEFVHESGQKAVFDGDKGSDAVRTMLRASAEFHPGGIYGRAHVAVNAHGKALGSGQAVSVKVGDKVSITADVGDRHPDIQTKEFRWSQPDGKPSMLGQHELVPGAKFDLFVPFW